MFIETNDGELLNLNFVAKVVVFHGADGWADGYAFQNVDGKQLGRLDRNKVENQAWIDGKMKLVEITKPAK